MGGREKKAPQKFFTPEPDEESKRFFFEKKNQKTFDSSAPAPPGRP
jgi:hypothetical protein